MKYSKTTKSNDMAKIIKQVSRDAAIDRNGGGQWVSTSRPHKNKKKYCRRDAKRALRNDCQE